MIDSYQEKLLDYYRYPRHKGRLADATHSSGHYHPSCGDQVSFGLAVSNGKINKIMFDGAGCVISMATASMLAEFLYQKDFSALIALSPDLIKQLIGIEVGPVRFKCALLSLYALQKLLTIPCSTEGNQCSIE